ncbi:hypothetical protein FE810_11105 [Thalassotalea litorea]|uniref:Uncharacterized protein n=1 Tax=Thalassotalea litorea TaxID=2020715 RepID=A0A5R9IGG9_9GAMM|nr:hypothetical protein [Thalassotalea litorea]TLU64630.1 hypothetical protein FE810_11105 [Thalassotalea litorea]
MEATITTWALEFIHWFAVFIGGFGVVITILPSPIFGFLGRFKHLLLFHFLAVAVRFLFGAALLYTASQTKIPEVVTILGYISIAAGGVLMLIGRNRFIRLIAWVARLTPLVHVVVGLVTVAFAVLVLYAYH